MARWNLGRFLLLVTMGLGILLMHHVPMLHAHPAESAAAYAGAADSSGHAQGRVHAGHEDGAGGAVHQQMPSSKVASSPDDMGTDSQHSPHGGLSLHLCLAILVSAVAVIGSLLLRRGAWPSALALQRDRTSAATPEPFTHSPPVARRLLTLCVLRL